VYAGCLGSDVVPVRTGTGRAGPAIRLRYQVGTLGMLPDGKTLYVDRHGARHPHRDRRRRLAYQGRPGADLDHRPALTRPLSRPGGPTS
jgi:hypothetical protein